MAHQGPSLLAFATPTHPHVPVPLLLVDSVVSQDPLVFLANTSVFDLAVVASTWKIAFVEVNQTADCMALVKAVEFIRPVKPVSVAKRRRSAAADILTAERNSVTRPSASCTSN